MSESQKIALSQANAALAKELEQTKAKLASAVMFTEDLQYQQTIDGPPVSVDQLWSNCTQGDKITIDSWWDTWLKNTEANAKEFDIHDTAMLEWDKFSYQPVIIAGSGPSLRKNAHLLKDRQGICLVSCLHNYGYFEDIGVKADYYLTLDAGDIVIPELSQGGAKDEEHYWKSTEDKTLLASITTPPQLIRQWLGKVRWYSAAPANMDYHAKSNAITGGYDCFFNIGGNALAACLYFGKAILGGNPIVLVGADCAFGYNKKFHPFDSPYDKQFSGLITAIDCFGNRVYTWPSYFGFKNWFEHVALTRPGIYINATEGGIVGAFAEGNLKQVMQMPLSMVLDGYTVHKKLPDALKKPEYKNKPVLLF